MAFIPYTVEDKTIATAYITVQDLIDFAAESVFIDSTKINNLSTEDKERYILNATAIIDLSPIMLTDQLGYKNEFVGTKYDLTQRLEFPRSTETVEEINHDIKVATAELTCNLINTPDLCLKLDYQAVKVKKVGSLELEYFEPQFVKGFKTEVPVITRARIDKYMYKYNGTRIIRVARG